MNIFWDGDLHIESCKIMWDLLQISLGQPPKKKQNKDLLLPPQVWQDLFGVKSCYQNGYFAPTIGI